MTRYAEEKRQKLTGVMILLKIQKRFSICLAAIGLAFSLTGCTSLTNPKINIYYSTGEHTLFRLDGNYGYPIVGSDYMMKTVQIEDVDDSPQKLQILDKDGQVQYEYLDQDYLQVERGEAVGDGTCWISCEKWENYAPKGRYTDDLLRRTQLIHLSLETGKVLFQAELKGSDLYLTTRGDRCYFYRRGKDASSKWFGLYQIPEEKAEIYYRDVLDWDTVVNVHTFDFAGEPDEYREEQLDENGEIKYLRRVRDIYFYLYEDSITFQVVGAIYAKGAGQKNGEVLAEEKISLSSEGW